MLDVTTKRFIERCSGKWGDLGILESFQDISGLKNILCTFSLNCVSTEITSMQNPRKILVNEFILNKTAM